jgi:hypothetical protein
LGIVNLSFSDNFFFKKIGNILDIFYSVNSPNFSNLLKIIAKNLSACCCCGIGGVAGCSPPAPTTTVFVTGIHDALSNDALPQLQSAFLRANFQTRQRALRSRRESRRRRSTSSWPTTLVLSTRSKIS